MSTSPTCVRCQKPLPAGYDTTRPCPACLFALGLGPLDSEEAALLVHTGSGEAEPPPEPHELAELFPQLEITELLGQGGMGAVYRARQTDLDRDVALKVLSPRVGSDPAFAERFAREARALAKLSHPNIVGVHDFGRSGPHYYLVMELVEGTNLRHLIRSKELEPHQALGIVEQVCAALQFAHDEGVVHRDIKPENILIDRAGRAKIADFGLAKMAQTGGTVERLTRTHQAMGTPQYMAPEQIEHPLEVDHRADIYSLGVVFYELLTGELPIGRFAPPSRMVQVDVRLDEVVLHALEKEPEQRYQQASHVATDLDGIKKGPASCCEPEGGPAVAAAAGRSQNGIRWGWVAMMAFLIAAIPLGCVALIAVGLSTSYRQATALEEDAARLEADAAMFEAGLEPFDPYSSSETHEGLIPGAPGDSRDDVRTAAGGRAGRDGTSLAGITLGVLAVAGLVFLGLVFLLVRGIVAHRRRGGGAGAWAWVLGLLLLITCPGMGCVALLLPWSVARVEPVAAPVPVPVPAPADPFLGPAEPFVDPEPSDPAHPPIEEPEPEEPFLEETELREDN